MSQLKKSAISRSALPFALALFFGSLANAQALPPQPAQAPQQSQAPYLSNPTVPPFHLLKLDSATYLTNDDIPKHHRTIIIYFSPECEHCQHETENILANSDKFRDIEIVMVSYLPLYEMKEFYTRNHLSEHSNIKMGRDEKFFFVPFYHIHNYPYLALYDKDGNLVTTFEGAQKIDTLLNAFSKK